MHEPVSFQSGAPIRPVPLASAPGEFRHPDPLIKSQLLFL